MTEDTTFRELPCHTHVEWDIKKFLYLPKEKNHYLTSQSFSLSHLKWYLRIYPNASKLKNSFDSIDMSLTRRHVSACYSINCILGIKKTDGSDWKVLEKEYTFGIGESEWRFNFIDRFDLIHSKDDLLPDGCLTIFCTTRIVDKIKSASELPPPEGTEILIENLKSLYLSKRYTDITILVKAKEFLVHKNILSARSAVFASMLEHDMAEKKSGIIEIPDCDPDSFGQFLLFLYTGKFDLSSSNVASLYETADKYDVKELRTECANFMRRDLTVDSFCSVIHLAAMHCEGDLLEAATKFFIDNVETILTTPKWQSFILENPLMGNELFFKAIKSKNSSEI